MIFHFESCFLPPVSACQRNDRRYICSLVAFMRRTSILRILEAGDRRTVGRSDQVAALVSKNPECFRELIAGLWSDNGAVRMRAADAAEKATRTNHNLLQPHKRELLGLMTEATQQELRWHLAVMVPRLLLSNREREVAISNLNRYLKDRSSIVKTYALQGLADLGRDDSRLRLQVIELLKEATRNGTSAMKARSRKLLAVLKVDGERT
jgi:hypothetical protein